MAIIPSACWNATIDQLDQMHAENYFKIISNELKNEEEGSESEPVISEEERKEIETKGTFIARINSQNIYQQFNSAIFPTSNKLFTRAHNHKEFKVAVQCMRVCRTDEEREANGGNRIAWTCVDFKSKMPYDTDVKKAEARVHAGGADTFDALWAYRFVSMLMFGHFDEIRIIRPTRPCTDEEQAAKLAQTMYGGNIDPKMLMTSLTARQTGGFAVCMSRVDEEEEKRLNTDITELSASETLSENEKKSSMQIQGMFSTSLGMVLPIVGVYVVRPDIFDAMCAELSEMMEGLSVNGTDAPKPSTPLFANISMSETLYRGMTKQTTSVKSTGSHLGATDSRVQEVLREAEEKKREEMIASLTPQERIRLDYEEGLDRDLAEAIEGLLPSGIRMLRIINTAKENVGAIMGMVVPESKEEFDHLCGTDDALPVNMIRGFAAMKGILAFLVLRTPIEEGGPSPEALMKSVDGFHPEEAMNNATQKIEHSELLKTKRKLETTVSCVVTRYAKAVDRPELVQNMKARIQELEEGGPEVGDLARSWMYVAVDEALGFELERVESDEGLKARDMEELDETRELVEQYALAIGKSEEERHDDGKVLGQEAP